MEAKIYFRSVCTRPWSRATSIVRRYWSLLKNRLMFINRCLQWRCLSTTMGVGHGPSKGVGSGGLGRKTPEVEENVKLLLKC